MKIIYLASVREAIGKDSESCDLPDQVETIAQLLDFLEARGGGYARILNNRRRLRFALDQQLVSIDAKIGQAVEIAIFPPVTGG